MQMAAHTPVKREREEEEVQPHPTHVLDDEERLSITISVLEKKRTRMEEAEKKLASRVVNLLQREEAVRLREEEVHRKEEVLAQKEATLQDKEDELQEKEKEVEERESACDTTAEALNDVRNEMKEFLYNLDKDFPESRY